MATSAYTLGREDEYLASANSSWARESLETANMVAEFGTRERDRVPEELGYDRRLVAEQCPNVGLAELRYDGAIAVTPKHGLLEPIDVARRSRLSASELPGEIFVEFSSAEEAAELIEISYPAVAADVRRTGRRRVPFRRLGTDPLRDLAYKMMAGVRRAVSPGSTSRAIRTDNSLTRH